MPPSTDSSSRTDAVDLARIVDDPSALTALLGSVATHTSSEEQLSAATLTGRHVSRELAETVFEFLDVKSYVEADANRETAAVEDRDAVIDLFVAAREARSTLDVAEGDSEAAVETEFVCTLPANDPAFEDCDAVDFDMRQITSRLLELCGEAEDDLVVTSPFLEEDGIDWLLPGLRGALERGVDVTVVSRELRPGEPNYRAIETLARKRSSLPGDLAVYDYYDAVGEDTAPTYTLHSKVMVVDERTAYVGSANFTKYGFSENLEVGTVVSGPLVADLRALLARVTAGSARRVDI